MTAPIHRPCADCGTPISVMRRWATRCPACKAKHRQAYSRAYSARRDAIAPREGECARDVEARYQAALGRLRADRVFRLTETDIRTQARGGQA
jgi:hypothetical protein